MAPEVAGEDILAEVTNAVTGTYSSAVSHPIRLAHGGYVGYNNVHRVVLRGSHSERIPAAGLPHSHRPNMEMKGYFACRKDHSVID